MNITPPEFPTEQAFAHGFEVFGNAYNNIDWICPAYNFAVALSHIGVALGKKYIVAEQGQHYPNFYQAILGRSHLAAKSPTLDRAVAGVDFLKRNIDPPECINIVTSLNSAEGFKEEFATHHNGDPDDPEDWFFQGNGVRVFVPVDELATLLSKTRQRATEGIAVELTRLYNPSDIAVENRTRKDKTYGIDWCVNVLGCSTLAWYERFITQGDFSSGFLNRFVFYLHEQMPVKSRFDPIDTSFLGVWQNMIKGLCHRSLALPKPKVYNLSAEAFTEFDKWFTQTYDYLIADPDDVHREAAARIITHVLKLSMVYAITGNTPEITLPQFLSARAVGEYWGKCAGLTLESIEFDRSSKAESIVMKHVKRLLDKNGECTRRQLRQSINSKTMSAEELNRALEALVNADMLFHGVDTNTGKKYILLTEEEGGRQG